MVQKTGTTSAGLFISPFVAQTRLLNKYFGAEKIAGWTASTAHKQQGAEATYLIFDTVNAGSTSWSSDEWKRLINVGLSRAKELLIVLASRAEMNQPYLRSLAPLLAPRVLRGSGGHFAWRAADGAGSHSESAATREERPWSLGAQIDARRALEPIFSEEQERLCVAKLDGGPRLVRGVAGSGKTVVLANWLARTLASEEERTGRHWVVYGNNSLKPLLEEAISSAWSSVGGKQRDLPHRRTEILHISEVLNLLESEMGIHSDPSDPYNYEARSGRILGRSTTTSLRPRARSLFIDEAQDMGHRTLELLAQLVECRNPKDPNSKAINIFYDNAQNLYGRLPPRWKDLGLDLRGRSTVMKESFRATRPITEFALNVLNRLRPLDRDADHKELVRNGLIQETNRNGRRWWEVRYNNAAGPSPTYRAFGNRADEIVALTTQIWLLVAEEGIRPGQIRVIGNGKDIREQLVTALGKGLRGLDIAVESQRRQALSVDERTLVVTTAHSLKGHEAEVVFVAAADRFFTGPRTRNASIVGVQAEALYVALTRARTLLFVSAVPHLDPAGREIHTALTSCLDDLCTPPASSEAAPRASQMADLLSVIGETQADWLDGVWKDKQVQRSPIYDPDGAIVAEPLFWIPGKEPGGYACFASQPPNRVRDALDDRGFKVLLPGDPTA